MSEINVREADEKDAEVLAEIDSRCFTSEAWPAEEFIANMGALGRFFAAEKNGSVIGCAGCIMIPGIQGEISTIAVLPEERGNGYSKLLMQRVINECAALDIPEIFLEVRVSNAPAIALYKGFGFEELGLRKNYYSDGEDAVTMVRR